MEGFFEFVTGGSAVLAAAVGLLLGAILVMAGLLLGRVALRRLGFIVAGLSLVSLLAIFIFYGGVNLQ